MIAARHLHERDAFQPADFDFKKSVLQGHGHACVAGTAWNHRGCNPSPTASAPLAVLLFRTNRLVGVAGALHYLRLEPPFVNPCGEQGRWRGWVRRGNKEHAI